MFSNKIYREHTIGIAIGFLLIALFLVHSASAVKNTNNYSGNIVNTGDRLKVDPESPIINWTTKAHMPTSRSDLYRGTMAIGDKIYVAGGWNNGSLDVVEVYDVGKDKWATVAPLPSPGINGAIQAVNGKLYIIGGNKNVGGDVDVWEYDPVTNNYSKKAPYIGENDPATAVVDGKIYALSSGITENGVKIVTQMYDPINDTWTSKAPHPLPRQHLTAEAVNGKIYTFGGNKNDNLTHEYDPVTDNWIEKSPMPVMIDSPNSVVVNGKIFAAGGDNSKAVWMYDPLEDVWQGPLDSEIPTPRALAATAEVNGKIYVIGGCCPKVNSNANEEGTVNFTIDIESLNATRSIEKESLRSGESTNITIRINSNVIQALALQESIPAGWNLTIISDDADDFNNNTNEWVWLNVTPGITRTVIYSITAPAGASIGTYYINGTISNSNGVIAIVGENNMITLDIFKYYRLLGTNPDILETTDLLKAIDDWGSGTAPAGFARPVTYNELNALINEWSTM
jgi:N-acetylneuraminic acid mutarotase